MNKRAPLPVSAALLSKYDVSESDLRWAETVVEAKVKASNINWTNIDSESKAIYSSALRLIDSKFQERFPDYAKDIAEHTVKGRNLNTLIESYSTTFIVLLIVSFVLMFVGLGLWFLLILIFGGLIMYFLIRISDSYDIQDGVPSELVGKKAMWISALKQAMGQAVQRETQRIFYSSMSNHPEVLRESVNGAWSPLGPRPSAPNGFLTPREAEIYVSKYMQFYGATGVTETRFSRDGGVDVDSDLFVAQVKHQEAKVGVKAVRELFAVASVAQKQPLFFAKVGFSKDAVEFANNVGISLFTYLPYLQASNLYAERYLKVGLGETLD